MQANRDAGDDRDDGDHGVDDDRGDSAADSEIGIRTPELEPLHSFYVRQAKSVSGAIRIAQDLSRSRGYAELFELDNGNTIALFVWGHQVAVNRFWRDSPAEDAPKGAEGK